MLEYQTTHRLVVQKCTSSIYKMIPLSMEIFCQTELILIFQKAGPITNYPFTNEKFQILVNKWLRQNTTWLNSEAIPDQF